MRILGTGAEIPEKVVPNAEVESRLGLEPGWIEQRTGILQRPTAAPSEALSDYAVRAGACAIRNAGMDPRDIGLLLLATSTPDHLLPPSAPLVAYRLGLTQAGAIDLTGACAGFLYGLALASPHRKPALVIGANLLTRRVNERDPATVALFSDGAGAVVIGPAEPSHLLGVHLGSDGSRYDAIGIPAGGTREPLTPEAVAEGRHLMTIRRGPGLFKEAVNSMADAGQRALEAARMTADQIDWWIPHQANIRITREAGRILGIPPDRTISVIDRYGNSSAATIPTALADAVSHGQVRRGHVLLLTAVGAGMISGGIVVRF